MKECTADFTARLDKMSETLADKLDAINTAKWLISDLEYQYHYTYQYDEDGNVIKDENGDNIRIKEPDSLRNKLLDEMIDFLINKVK